MHNQLSTRSQETDVPVRNTQHGDFRNLITHFWNMIDFPQHHELSDMEPKIEVSENKNNVTVTAEMPGVAEEDIDVEISSDGYMTISGEKKHEYEENKKGSYFSEISYGVVKRTIPLPWDLEFSKADAEYDNGILKIAIPKSAVEQTKKKKISVSKKTKETASKRGRRAKQ